MPIRNTAAALLLAAGLSSCAAVQVRENTLQMVDSVSRIRDVQVLRNIAVAISDHNMVPTEILLSTGQASVAIGGSSSLMLPRFDFSDPTRELDLGASDSWTAQWQVAPVTNADDLRRLRNLYVLVVSTDQQYDELEGYFVRHKDARAGAGCSEPPAASGAGGQGAGCGPGAGQIPDWRLGREIIRTGDSIGCKLYQEDFQRIRDGQAAEARRGLPFRRWLYWRTPGGAWGPTTPETAPEPLGKFRGWEIGITSRACFNDFVILVQSATPAAANASGQGPKLMLNAP
jgi:hypothetical protein